MIKHALVIGGTGMLAETTLWLSKQNYYVSVIGRNQARLQTLVDKGSPHITGISVDYRDYDHLQNVVIEAIKQRGPIDLVVSWIHSTAPHALEIICNLVSEHTENSWHLYHVRGSAAYLDRYHPIQDKLPESCLYHQILLGFVREQEYSRWLTHHEISSGIIDAIQEQSEEYIVGQMEPWELRP